jgi:hypothetical protein
VPVVEIFGALEHEWLTPSHQDHPAANAPAAVYGRRGETPEVVVVTRDATGQLRSASWALRPSEDPGLSHLPA